MSARQAAGRRSLYFKLAAQTALFPVMLGAVIFVVAGTLDYWQAWLFLLVFTASTIPVAAWVAINDPALLERRQHVGPAAETRRSQKVISATALIVFAGVVVLPALDRRLGWSELPTWGIVAGDTLIALAYLGFFLVYRENTYGGSTVAVEEGQRVIETDPYALMRHPMYAAAVLLAIGTPLALASWWALLALAPGAPALVWRVMDEEGVLARELPGYTAYARKVRTRVLPWVW